MSCISASGLTVQLPTVPPPRSLPRRNLFLLEIERAGVDAVAKARRLRAVLEDVAEMAAAGCADHFLPDHPVRRVDAHLDALERRGRKEARPAGAGMELG